MSSPPAPTGAQPCTVSVELPERIARLLGATPQAAARRLKELVLIELFRQGELSSGWAAEQLEISKDDFLDLLATHDVPYIDMSEEELRQQVEVAMPRQGRSTT